MKYISLIYTLLLFLGCGNEKQPIKPLYSVEDNTSQNHLGSWYLNYPHTTQSMTFSESTLEYKFIQTIQVQRTERLCLMSYLKVAQMPLPLFDINATTFKIQTSNCTSTLTPLTQARAEDFNSVSMCDTTGWQINQTKQFPFLDCYYSDNNFYYTKNFFFQDNDRLYFGNLDAELSSEGYPTSLDYIGVYQRLSSSKNDKTYHIDPKKNKHSFEGSWSRSFDVTIDGTTTKQFTTLNFIGNTFTIQHEYQRLKGVRILEISNLIFNLNRPIKSYGNNTLVQVIHHLPLESKQIWTILDSSKVETYNKNNTCGKNDWKINTPVDVTTLSCRKGFIRTAFLISAPRVIGIYQENDTIYLAIPPRPPKSVADEYKLTIDYATPYSKIN